MSEQMRGLEAAMRERYDVLVLGAGAGSRSRASAVPFIDARHRNHSQTAFQLRHRLADPLFRCALVRAIHIRKKRKADP